MEHSVQAYIERHSSAELLGFLDMCMRQSQWEQYAHIIPHIFTALQSRNVLMPELIRSSWESFIGNAQAASY